jgi:hypothetical protein
MDWARQDLTPFGLSCEVFGGPDIALELESTEGHLYLSQGSNGYALWVSWRPGETFDVWLARVLNDGTAPATVVEPRAPTRLCGVPAERVAIEAVLPPGAVGHREDGVVSLESGTVRIVLVGAQHRGTPLVAGFRRPAVDSDGSLAEARFFESFRCQA